MMEGLYSLPLARRMCSDDERRGFVPQHTLLVFFFFFMEDLFNLNIYIVLGFFEKKKNGTKNVMLEVMIGQVI